MKKQLVSVFCAAILLFSGCSKEKQVDVKKDETLYPVTFNVNTFQKEISPMANLRSPKGLTGDKSMQASAGNIQAASAGDSWLGDEIESLRYIVLNDAGIIVKNESIERKILIDDGTGTANFIEVPNERFGLIQDELPNGNYTVALVGYNGPLRTLIEKNNRVSINNYDNPTSEAFFSKLQVSVNNSPIEESVTLNRIVGKLEIKLLDEIPSSIHRIEYSIANITQFYYLFERKFITDNQAIRTTYTSSPTIKDDLFLYFFYDDYGTLSGNATVDIRAYNNAGNLVVDKTINDVPVGQNQKTVLTGTLFDDPGTSGQGFTVTINTDWSGTNEVEF